MRFRRKYWRGFWAIGNMNLVMSDSGDGIIEGTLVDITARKHVEAELYQSRQMLQSVLDNIPQRVFWKDRNSIYLGCNRAFATERGKLRQKLLANPILTSCGRERLSNIVPMIGG